MTYLERESLQNSLKIKFKLNKFKKLSLFLNFRIILLDELDYLLTPN